MANTTTPSSSVAALRLGPLAPIVRFSPPLSMLLRLNSNEVPFNLANYAVHLRREEPDVLNEASLTHVDAPPAMPINGKQAQTFASFRTVGKRFDNVVFAIAHALYGDVTQSNALIDALRIRFLGPERAANEKKSKVKLEAILYALCEANRGTIDIAILSPQRDYFSLYTYFSGHVLHEAASTGGQSAASSSNRTLVALELNTETQQWSPVGYSLRATTGSVAVSEVPSDNAGAHDARRSSAHLSAGGHALRSGVSGIVVDSEDDGSASSSADASEDDYADAATVASDAPQSFQQMVRDADQVYHMNPYIDIQQGIISKPSVAAVPIDDASVNRLPFQAMRYPNLDMTDCGCTALIAETANPQHLPRTFSRLFITSVLAAGALAVATAILVLWWDRDLSACCVDGSAPDPSDINVTGTVNGTESLNTSSTPHLFTCWDLGSAAYVNASTAPTSEAQCIARMCPRGGTLRDNAVFAYLYGALLAPGRCLWLAMSAAGIALCLSLGVNHFTMRFLALNKARPRFLYWLSVLHVIVSTSLCVVSGYILSQVLEIRDGPIAVTDCDWYSNVARAVCIDAQQSQCTTSVMVHLQQPAVAVALGIVLVALSGANWVVCFVPPLPSPTLRAQLPHAVPDTSIFVPGRFAPDGATEDELTRLQLNMKLRALGGRWDSASGRWNQRGRTASPSTKALGVGERKPSVAGGGARGRLAKVLQNVRRNVNVAGALRGMLGAKAAAKMAQQQAAVGDDAAHYAVHESGDRYESTATKELHRHMSLTFVPRTADQTHLSGATLREVQRIGNRVRDRLEQEGLTVAEPPRPLHGARPQLANEAMSKYRAMELQVEAMGSVAVQRDAVVAAVVERLARKKKKQCNDDPVDDVHPPGWVDGEDVPRMGAMSPDGSNYDAAASAFMRSYAYAA